MANFRPQEEIDALAATATLLPSASCHDLDESSARRCRETSPWQKGHIIYADVNGGDDPPVRVLVKAVEVEAAFSARYDYVNHAYGFVERKGGGWGRMGRHIKRGAITRGYEKARKLGWLPAEDGISA